mgnify:CR=1 FL=1
MKMISLELPIYYTFTKKTKKDNKVLVGMNWYRNAHFRSSNQVKQHYHKLIYSKVTQSQKLKDKYKTADISTMQLFRIVRDNNITLKLTRIRHEPVKRFGKDININYNLERFYEKIKEYNLY